ncbi:MULTISPECIES: TnsA endonuclease N-terminal domain-containing protein [unclassified Methylobacterium]|jgi:hypothetical protein|uniref:TnsA endonuclease N-terminal domain-containing protein n=1 Tax=unclassified Methylobacterium TaxID=2615210 RepID=UPI001367A8CB|nr:TnsA endonuclease N-terminal domain-containing protein [Methylobacterium sp. 2A]
MSAGRAPARRAPRPWEAALTNAPFFQHSDSRFDLDTALLDIRTAAKIDVGVRGGPVRLIINGRHHKPVGRYASRKARRSLPWEALAELAYLWVCEADADVVSYLSQPHRLTIRLPGGKSAVYYPDVRRDLADGGVEIVEIKKREEDARRTPDYALKLELARLVYEGLGWTYLILSEADLKDRRELRTAEAIQRNRTARVTGQERHRLAEAVYRAGGSLPFAEAAEALGGGSRGRAKLHAAIVLRVVSIDLTRPLNRGAPVRLVSPAARAAVTR